MFERINMTAVPPLLPPSSFAPILGAHREELTIQSGLGLDTTSASLNLRFSLQIETARRSVRSVRFRFAYIPWLYHYGSNLGLLQMHSSGLHPIIIISGDHYCQTTLRRKSQKQKTKKGVRWNFLVDAQTFYCRVQKNYYSLNWSRWIAYLISSSLKPSKLKAWFDSMFTETLYSFSSCFAMSVEETCTLYMPTYRRSILNISFTASSSPLRNAE